MPFTKCGIAFAAIAPAKKSSSTCTRSPDDRFVQVTATEPARIDLDFAKPGGAEMRFELGAERPCGEPGDVGKRNLDAGPIAVEANPTLAEAARSEPFLATRDALEAV